MIQPTLGDARRISGFHLNIFSPAKLALNRLTLPESTLPQLHLGQGTHATHCFTQCQHGWSGLGLGQGPKGQGQRGRQGPQRLSGSNANLPCSIARGLVPEAGYQFEGGPVW